MFLCDVPLFIKQNSLNNDNADGNLLRLMGTVGVIIQSAPSLSSDNIPESNPHESNNSTHSKRLIHFVIDDGTGSIGVFTRRRVKQNSDCVSDSFVGNIPPVMQNQLLVTQRTKQNHHFQAVNQPPHATVTLESILSSPPPPILVGQTVDCIGRIQVDTSGEGSSSHSIWLAASSVSIIKNPQEITLRQLELSSTKRLQIITAFDRGAPERGSVGDSSNISNNPRNRILVGGDLERKLNPLFHCNREGSVVFNMEDAFNYIKHSKDDGGITPHELALLVGAVEPNEMLAVNLAVEQLREDCRIYLNHGKWFPM